MPFIPHTEDDVKQMLEVIGVDSIDDLFDEIPAALRAGDLSAIPEGMWANGGHRDGADAGVNDGAAG